MKTMSKAQLEALEEQVNAELKRMADSERSIHKHDPITDGVVDIERYLSSSPKMLWIWKEPWEEFDENGGGVWSVTQNLIPKKIAEGKIGNKGLYANMAYITYSVFNNYPNWSEIPWVTDDPSVGESLKSIAYINVNKFPGKKWSNPEHIKSCYGRNRNILKKQVATINPDVVIVGNILHLFYEDFGLKTVELISEGSVEFCSKDGCLYINAYHPSYWRISGKKYVEDIVNVIKKNRHGSALRQ